MVNVYVLMRYDGAAYVVAVFGSIESARSAMKIMMDNWRVHGRPVMWYQSASHPERWTSSTGEVFEIATFLVQS